MRRFQSLPFTIYEIYHSQNKHKPPCSKHLFTCYLNYFPPEAIELSTSLVYVLFLTLCQCTRVRLCLDYMRTVCFWWRLVSATKEMETLVTITVPMNHVTVELLFRPTSSSFQNYKQFFSELSTFAEDPFLLVCFG